MKEFGINKIDEDCKDRIKTVKAKDNCAARLLKNITEKKVDLDNLSQRNQTQWNAIDSKKINWRIDY